MSQPTLPTIPAPAPAPRLASVHPLTPPRADDVPHYLQSKGVQVYATNGNEVTTHCLWCSDGDPKGKGKLYINTESWLYDCKRCGEAGNRRTLLRHFGDQDTETYEAGADPYVRRQIIADAAEVAAEMLLNNTEMLAYLSGRGLTMATVLAAKIGYVPVNTALSRCLTGDYKRADLISAGVLNKEGQEFFCGYITIPYIQRGQVVSMRAKDPRGKYLSTPGDVARFYNADTLADAENVIVVEGEFDALILRQTLLTSHEESVRSIGVVGVPGARTLPQGFTTAFSEAKHVFLGFDPDEPGRKAAAAIKEVIGTKARLIDLPGDLPKCDWTEYLSVRGKGLDDVLELLGSARGKRLWSVAEAGAKYRRAMVEAPGIKTGYAQLDAWYAPGVRAGDLCIPLAKTGVGKTNFLVNLAHNLVAREGCVSVPTLLCSLEMLSRQVYERLARVWRFYNPAGDDAEMARAFHNLRIVDQNRLEEGDISLLCDEYAEELGMRPQCVMVDYLGYYARSQKGAGNYEKVTNAVMSLKAEAKSAEVGLWAPHQVNRQAEDGRPISADDARDSGAVEETADLLVSLFRASDAVEGSTDPTLTMQVLKNRNGMKGQRTHLTFSNASLVLCDRGSTADVLCQKENLWTASGWTYEQIIRERSGSTWATRQEALL